jgi:E3 ubiquitin-protein ligase synoviolin
MYPDVTPQQLATFADTVCIICREEMANAPNDQSAPAQQVKKLPCDHIFHKSCLRSWFQRQQTCPTCRTPILRLATPAAAAPPPAAQAPNPDMVNLG